jgi:hypothetical protein
MGYNHIQRFKKQHNLERQWNMSLKDVAEISGREVGELLPIYEETLRETKSREQAINSVCSFVNGGSIHKKSSKKEVNGV